MDSQNAIVSTALLDPDHGVGQKPVVGVDQVETADKIFNFKNAVHEAPTHVIDVVNEVIVGQVRAAMIVDAAYVIVTSLSRRPPGENVYLVAFPCQRRCQFGYMDCDPSNGDRMQ
jgi:hypothetical protein